MNAIGSPTSTATQSDPAAGTLAERGDRRGHHRDAHRDTQRDDVLRADVTRCRPPSRCTVAPAGNGPCAGGPTTARARRRPTWSGVGTDAEAGTVDLGGRELDARAGAQRVVGHARGA